MGLLTFYLAQSRTKKYGLCIICKSTTKYPLNNAKNFNLTTIYC